MYYVFICRGVYTTIDNICREKNNWGENEKYFFVEKKRGK